MDCEPKLAYAADPLNHDSQQPSNKPAPTKADYLSWRKPYEPTHPKIIFIFESPPMSREYFYNSTDYNPEGQYSESLYRAMMHDVLQFPIKPRTKDEGLKAFAAHDFLLLDATYTPVNDNKVSSYTRNKLAAAQINKDLPTLIEELHKYVKPDTGIILAKVNVCDLLEGELLKRKFKVLNCKERIPFPSNGGQNGFRDMVRPLLGFGGRRL